ncbi:MAG: SurA N-terminal domain-containing protein, partial [Syntrophales bacterium]
MDQEQCRRCGKEIAVGDKGYCPDCQGDMKHKRLKRRWFPAGAIAILILAGAVYAYGEKNAWDFSWDALLGRPAAVVNGEPISRSALKERLTISRRMLEQEYGKELFTGDRGAVLLVELEQDVLEKMVKERLVVQEASRLKIAVGDEQIRQELQTIAGEIYGTWEKFQASLKEDGISPEYMADHVRNL